LSEQGHCINDSAAIDDIASPETHLPSATAAERADFALLVEYLWSIARSDPHSVNRLYLRQDQA
jgi:hypothetical protein